MTVLRDQIHANIERRLYLKKTVSIANLYRGEGRYYCAVQNIRGGSILMRQLSAVVTVVVERAEPTRLKMQPLYTPRKRPIRREWVSGFILLCG